VDSPVTAVLFDFDGVIMGSQGSLTAARQLLRSKKLKWSAAAKNLTALDVIKIFELSDMGDSYKSIVQLYRKFAKFLPNRFQRLYFLQKIGKIYPEYDNLIGRIKLGVKETLQALHAKGIPLAIVSNSNTTRIAKLVAKFGIKDFLTAIITRDDMKGYKVKPSAYPILICLLKMKKIAHLGSINRQQVYFIGDLPTDVQCAKNAKVRSIAVTTGHGNPDELKVESPDYLIPGVKNLFSIPEFQKLRSPDNT
jgi:phosphoglycolate phosphatase-like HAD superfamily hydrolase